VLPIENVEIVGEGCTAFACPGATVVGSVEHPAKKLNKISIANAEIYLHLFIGKQ